MKRKNITLRSGNPLDPSGQSVVAKAGRFRAGGVIGILQLRSWTWVGRAGKNRGSPTYLPTYHPYNY